MYDRFDSMRLEAMLEQSWQIRRDPKEREMEERSAKSAELNQWLNNADLNEIVIVKTDANGQAKTLTLEQINNFEF